MHLGEQEEKTGEAPADTNWHEGQTVAPARTEAFVKAASTIDRSTAYFVEAAGASVGPLAVGRPQEELAEELRGQEGDRPEVVSKQRATAALSSPALVVHVRPRPVIDASQAVVLDRFMRTTHRCGRSGGWLIVIPARGTISWASGTRATIATRAGSVEVAWTLSSAKLIFGYTSVIVTTEVSSVFPVVMAETSTSSAATMPSASTTTGRVIPFTLSLKPATCRTSTPTVITTRRGESDTLCRTKRVTYRGEAARGSSLGDAKTISITPS